MPREKKLVTHEIFTGGEGYFSYTVVTSYKEYKKTMRALGLVPKFVTKAAYEDSDPYVTEAIGGAGKGPCLAIVSLPPYMTKKQASDQCRIVAHEATHVKQVFMQWIGEHNPSVEFEAYVVGLVAEVLFNYVKTVDTNKSID